MDYIRYMDDVKGNWIVRSYSRGGEKKFLYLGVFVPKEPFLAVYAEENEQGEFTGLYTEPVQAFVVRVTVEEGDHVIESLPIVFMESYLGIEEESVTLNFLGVVPERLFQELKESFEKSGRARIQYLNQKIRKMHEKEEKENQR